MRFPLKIHPSDNKKPYIFNPVLQLNPSKSGTSSLRALPTSWHSQGGHEDPEHPLRGRRFRLPTANTTRGRSFGKPKLTAQFSRFGSPPHHAGGSLLHRSGTHRHAPAAELDPSGPVQSGAGSQTRGAGGEHSRRGLTRPLAEPALPSRAHRAPARQLQPSPEPAQRRPQLCLGLRPPELWAGSWRPLAICSSADFQQKLGALGSSSGWSL